MNLSLRDSILQVHRWTGLTLGLAAVLIAVSGLSMVFRAQLEPLVDRDIPNAAACAARLPLDGLVAEARVFHPEPAVARIELPEGAAGVTVVRFADTRGVYVDSCTGAMLGMRDPWSGFFGFVEQVHRLRFLGGADITEPIGGALALALIVAMVGGGLVTWWPSTRRALKASFKLRLKLKGAAFDVNLHRTAGIYTAFFILLSATTSLTFTFEWARNLVFRATGSAVPAPKPRVQAAAAPMLPLEGFLARAFALVPDAREMVLTYPRKAGEAVEVYAVARDAPHPTARSFIYLHPASGEVLRFEPYETSSAGHKLYRWLGSLHTGHVGGMIVQILLFAGILGVPVLAFTGVRSWWRRTFG
jgi:uncharacterized iron-regulated membrane protein